MQSSDATAAGNVDVATTLRRVVARWKIIFAAVVIALLSAIIYLNLATYRYSVEMRLAPVTGLSSDGLSSKLSSLGGLAAVAGVSLPDGGGLDSFRLFVEAIHSRDVADRLARDPVILHGVFAREWDATTRTWRLPQGFTHDVAAVIKQVVGISQRAFTPPDPARLQQWIADQVVVDQSVKTPVVSVSMLSDDPAFAILFLDRLSSTVDTLLRERALLRTDDYIAYLSTRLPAITLFEQRVAIAAALGEQERMKMAASSDRAYAAEVFDHPAASDRPVSPVPIKVLGIAVMLGLAIGIGIALLLPPARTAAAVV